MSSAQEVEAAAQQFNGYELGGRPLRVNAGPPPQKSESPFRGGSSSPSSSRPSPDNSYRLYVGNLSWGVDDSALETLFSEQGKVLDCKVIFDRETGRSKGFGFVTYGSADEVNNALYSLDGGLSSIGINPQFITFTHVTMESDKYICVRETSPQNSVVIVDMNMPMQPLRRPITVVKRCSSLHLSMCSLFSVILSCGSSAFSIYKGGLEFTFPRIGCVVRI